MIASVSLSGYWVDTSNFMIFNVCQGWFCFSLVFLLFFVGYLCKILHVQIAFIYVVPQPIWTTIWWAKYSGEIINTDCHFWFRKRSVLRTLGTYLTHGLIVVYIYMRLSGPKKKEQDNALSNISSDLKKNNMRMCRFQFTCRLNADAIRFDPLFSVIWQNVAGMLIAAINWIVKDIGILCGKVSSPRFVGHLPENDKRDNFRKHSESAKRFGSKAIKARHVLRTRTFATAPSNEAVGTNLST